MYVPIGPMVKGIDVTVAFTFNKCIIFEYKLYTSISRNNKYWLICDT